MMHAAFDVFLTFKQKISGTLQVSNLRKVIGCSAPVVSTPLKLINRTSTLS